MLTFQEIFELALKLGRSNDPRPKSEIEYYLNQMRKEFEALDKEKKELFDIEKLTNPYPDSRLLNNPQPKKKIKRVFVGIDIGIEDLLLVRELGRTGTVIDGVISHHPLGRARVDLPDNMHLQVGLAGLLGIPVNVAEKLLEPRIKEVTRSLSPANNYRVTDAARLMEMSLMCLHTVADNHVHSFVDRYLEKRLKKLLSVGDVLDSLMEISEFKEASRLGIGPKIYVGDKKSRAGKIAVTGMTGGTEGSVEIYERFARAGVGTIIEMHISEDRVKSAKKFHLNVVMSGHMASDSLGMNLIMDQVERRGTEIVAGGGYIRVKR